MLKWEENNLITNYCKKFVNNNLWKVQTLGYEFDDLYQECWIVFDRCKREYPDVEDNHFMALFKKALINMINTLSVKDTKEREMKATIEDFYDIISREEEISIAEFNVTISEAPDIIKKTIELLDNPPKKFNDRIGIKGYSNNKLLCSLLGLSSYKVNLYVLLQEYFKC